MLPKYRHLLLALALAPVLAQGEATIETTDPAATEAPASAGEAEPEDPVICRRITPTGSRVAKKVCMPRSEWMNRSKGGGVKLLRQSDCGAGNCDITPLPQGGG